MKTLAVALLCATLGGCVVLPDHDRYRGDRYYGQRYDRDYDRDRRVIPYRDDGHYGRGEWRNRDDDYRGRGRGDRDDD